jgi:tetratricopeptide (TPR) repeat protein
MDIPAGAQDYVVEDSYVLPTEVEVLAVLPHAHYLAREMQGWATRPDGSKEWLLFIKEWDFNWQGDYRYARPVLLPRGSKLSMRFTFDNSTNNVRNPNHPPKPVTYGPQSSDEMAELWFQLLPRNRADRELLSRDVQMKKTRLFIEADEYALRKNPNDARAHDDLATMLVAQGRLREAEEHFRSAIQVEPDFALAHYDYGVLLRQQTRLAEAQVEFETVLRLNPKDSQAHGNLGAICLQQGDLAAARTHFEAALRLNPDDALARAGLAEATQAKGTNARKLQRE